jgi:acetyl esterase/lipase
LDLESFGVGDAGASGAAAMVQQFLGPNGDIRDPLVDPLRGKLTGLGPLYIQVGGDEVGFIAPAERLADAARAEGIRVEIDIVPDMQHMFQLWAGNMPEADDALDRIAAFFASVLAP